MRNRKIILTFFIIFCLSCHSRPVHPSNDIEIDLDIETEAEIDVNTPSDYKVTFIAVGDNLYHNSMITTSLTANGTYDFTPIYTEIKDIVSSADLAFINQESPMAGERFGHTGFPVFNTPQSLAHALVDAGFNILNLANNHALDMRAEGLYATLDFLDTIKELTVIGARRSGESAVIVTKNNISFGFLAYTFSVNGFTIPANNPNLVSLINRTKMAEEINALRPLCDFLIVSMHWGDEYALTPSREQISLANFLAERDVDLIIGHHPHVLQRVDTITRSNGKKTICYYSLGNLVTHQLEWERLIGGMAVVTFTKEGTAAPDGKIIWSGEQGITDFGMIPLITHFEQSRFRDTKIYTLYNYTEELLKLHGLRTRPAEPKPITMNYFYNVLNRLHTKIIMHDPF